MLGYVKAYCDMLNMLDMFDQIQYKAAKLVGSALHYTRQHKLETNLGWESMKSRAEVLGLTVYHKIHFNKTNNVLYSSV